MNDLSLHVAMVAVALQTSMVLILISYVHCAEILAFKNISFDLWTVPSRRNGLALYSRKKVDLNIIMNAFSVMFRKIGISGFYGDLSLYFQYIIYIFHCIDKITFNFSQYVLNRRLWTVWGRQSRSSPSINGACSFYPIPILLPICSFFLKKYG